MSLQPISYTKGSHHANASIVATPDGKFQGTVALSHSGGNAGEERHVVSVASDTPQEAMEEAKALAHRLLSDLQ